jgi:hypothetical protein
MAVEENFSNLSDLLNLLGGLLQLFAGYYFVVSFQEILSLDSLLFSGSAGIDLSHSFSEVFSLVSVEDLIPEIRPVKLGVRFSINADDNPFENVIGF